MKTIHKYPLIGANVQLMLPYGAEILSAQHQLGNLFLWALADPGNTPEPRRFVVLGTGWNVSMDDNLRFIATSQNNGFVWHIFEEVK